MSETQELNRLMTQLDIGIKRGEYSTGKIIENKYDDEIVILHDSAGFSDCSMIFWLEKYRQLEKYQQSHDVPVRVIDRNFDKDFGEHKTFGSRQCKGDFICQIDADEYLADGLMENIHDLIELNPEVDLFRIPRINTVRGLTEADIKKWGWHISTVAGLQVVNFPDYQGRLYRNDPCIFWKNKVHESITGAKVVTDLPAEPEWSLIHPKNIDRQREQNALYDKILKG